MEGGRSLKTWQDFQTNLTQQVATARIVPKGTILELRFQTVHLLPQLAIHLLGQQLSKHIHLPTNTT